MTISVDDIFGILKFLGKNYTVSDIYPNIGVSHTPWFWGRGGIVWFRVSDTINV